MKDDPFKKELEEFISYDPLTGKLKWVKNTSQYGKNMIGLEAGALNKLNGYRFIRFKCVKYSSHSLAWLLYYGQFPKNTVDHKNRNRSDNRINNLRDVTVSENQRNKKIYKNNKSGVRGVHFCKTRKKWGASIKINDTLQGLGLYSLFEDAVKARQEAEESLSKL